MLMFSLYMIQLSNNLQLVPFLFYLFHFLVVISCTLQCM